MRNAQTVSLNNHLFPAWLAEAETEILRKIHYASFREHFHKAENTLFFSSNFAPHEVNLIELALKAGPI